MARARPAARAKAPPAPAAAPTAFPDGVGQGHANARGAHRYANLASVLVLGGIVGAALLGTFGGDKSPVVTAAAPAATLTVKTPHVMRSGIFFETRVTVAASQPIGDVVIALPPALWRDQTINTTVPGADREESADGRFRFHYGKLEPGKTLEIKYDGQINPPLFAGTEGSVALFDGERPIAAIPLTIRVWP